MKRLYLATNLAIVLVLGITLRLLGLSNRRYIYLCR
jgi:hypothetical protein